MENKRTVAERLHDSFRVQMEVDELISDMFEKHEPKIYDALDFSVGSDEYDNSIEIYVKNYLPYPYEPCYEIRKAIFDLGFGTVYWNFVNEECKAMTDEIRGYEPRHYKDSSKWKGCKYGGVDDRFNEEEWNKNYNFKHK